MVSKGPVQSLAAWLCCFWKLKASWLREYTEAELLTLFTLGRREEGGKKEGKWRERMRILLFYHYDKNMG